MMQLHHVINWTVTKTPNKFVHFAERNVQTLSLENAQSVQSVNDIVKNIDEKLPRRSLRQRKNIGTTFYLAAKPTKKRSYLRRNHNRNSHQETAAANFNPLFVEEMIRSPEKMSSSPEEMSMNLDERSMNPEDLTEEIGIVVYNLIDKKSEPFVTQKERVDLVPAPTNLSSLNDRIKKQIIDKVTKVSRMYGIILLVGQYDITPTFNFIIFRLMTD